MNRDSEHFVGSFGTPILLDEHDPPSLLQVRLAGAAGLEPATLGFGDRCSTN